MKGSLLEAVNRRFRDMESEPLFLVAMLQDPAYKDGYVVSLLTLCNMILMYVREQEWGRERERNTQIPYLSMCL